MVSLIIWPSLSSMEIVEEEDVVNNMVEILQEDSDSSGITNNIHFIIASIINPQRKEGSVLIPTRFI